MQGADAAPAAADARRPDIQPTTMFVHSNTTLYTVDDQDFELAEIGPFGPSAEDRITDLAVDPDGALFAISSDQVFEVDAQTGAATPVTSFDGGHNVAMTFLDSGDLLVSDKEGAVRRVGPQSGQVTELGAFGRGYGTAGDLVAIADGTMFAIAEDLEGDEGDPNVLVTIDPATGEIETVRGPIGFTEVFGCAYAGGKVYAFTRGGDIIQIDPATGAGTLVRSHPEVTFWGAGVSPLVGVE